MQRNKATRSSVLFWHSRAGSRPRSASIGDSAASVCDDTVRLNFARNDLLAWGNSGNEYNLVRSCSGGTLLDNFVHRAVTDADRSRLEATRSIGVVASILRAKRL